MEMDNVTIVPPKTPEHKYPVVSIGPVPLRQEVVDKLIEFCRNNEMADIYWLATEKRPDIRENILHDDSREAIEALLDARKDIHVAVVFISTFYYTVEFYYNKNHVPTPSAGGPQVFLPCKIPNGPATFKTYNIASLVPGRNGLPAPYAIDDPKFRYRCSWCFNRRADPSQVLQKCSTCRAKRYCHSECQLADWKAGHNKECKPVVDVDID